MASKNRYTPGVFFEDNNINNLGKVPNNDKYNRTLNLIKDNYLADELFGDLLLSEEGTILSKEMPVDKTEIVTITTTTAAPTTTTTTIAPVSDVDLIRQLRDANPSVLGMQVLFDDNNDPYTTWWVHGGALFGSSPYLISLHQSGYLADAPPFTPLIPDKCYILSLSGFGDYLNFNEYANITSQLTKLTTLLNQ